MSNRFLMSPDGFRVSKPGVDVTNPNVAPDQLLFDSSWLFSGMVIKVGVHNDSAPYRNSGEPPQNVIQWAIPTDKSSPQEIYFGPLPYVPTVFLIPLADSRYWQRYGMVLLGADVRNTKFGNDYYRTGEITIDTNKITIPRVRSKNGGYYYREEFMYIVMGM